jgi:hypothetical protein
MNHVQAKCGHYVIAVGAPGSIARDNCERYACETCSQEETEVMAKLFRAHPSYGKRAISINDCLECRRIPAELRKRFDAIYARNYGQ